MYLFKIIKWKIKNIQQYIRYSISYIFNASIIFENWTKLWSDSFIVLMRARTPYSAGNAWTKCAQTSILANANVISAWHVGTRDTRNRGHEPKIISVCCFIRRDSLWESRQPTFAARRETVEAAKYFSAADIVLFFWPNRVWTRVYKLSYIRSGRGYAVASSIGVSVLSSKLPLSFIASPALFIPIHPVVLYGAFPTKGAAGAIYATRVKKEEKRVTRIKGPRFDRQKQTVVNRGPKEAERASEGQLVERLRTYRRICSSYNAGMYKVSRAYFYYFSQIRDYIGFYQKFNS